MANFYAQYPASSGGSSANASVGINGVTAPTSSTEVGGINPTGNLQPLQTDASGNLLVSLAAEPGAPLHVIVDSSALPTGASTSALQGTGNTSLASIATNTANIPAKGQATMANSTPVAIASDQSAIPVSGTIAVTGVATAANQTNASQKTQVVDGAGNVITSTNDGGGKQGLDVNIAGGATLATTTNLIQVGSSNITLGQKTEVASLPVVIASDQSSIPVTVASLPLPTGGSTAALQSNVQSAPGTPQTVAITVQGNASGVPIPVTTAAATDLTASGSITTQNLNPNSGAATAASTVSVTSINGQTTATIQVTGTYTGALTAQMTTDGTNWIALAFIQNINTAANAANIASATVGIFQADIAGATAFRISANAAVTGTAVVTIRVTTGAALIALDAPIPAGTNIIGALSANQSTNVAQINGVAPLMGNGVTGTGSLRVTLASDTSSNTNPLLVSTSGRSLANAPTVTTYGTPVTSAAYVTIIASTTSATNLVEIFDSSGVAIFFAVGAAASEVNQFVIYPGGNGQVPLKIPAGSRISYKAVSTSATGASAFNVLNLYT